MKKIVLFGIIAFLLVVAIAFAASLSKEQRAQVNECRLDCGVEKKLAQKTCQEESKICVDSCNQVHDGCLNNTKMELESCNILCEQTWQTNSTHSSNKETQRNLHACFKQCQRNFTQSMRNECNIGSCKRECAMERSECITEANEDQRFCSQSCNYLFLNSSITCENGKYQAGQTIWKDCDTCKCGFDGKLKCTQHASCNFNGFNETAQDECESAGGFYQELCQGNIYAMRCTEEFYCQCDGYNEYTCPDNHICLKEFKTHGILSGNLKTWSERRGLPLGDIGICAPLPEIESCGNGVCEDIVVNGMAETSLNCPADCSRDIDLSKCHYAKDTEQACPTVCIPMLKIENNTCSFDHCGSGCGADNVSTFCSFLDCKAKITT